MPRKLETKDGSLIVLAKGTPLQIVVVTAFVAAILWFLSIRIGGYFYRTDLYSDPAYFNLTKAGVQWDVYYGTSPMCGKVECFASMAQPLESYQKRMVLPAREFPLNGYVAGQRIYLRATVTLPESVLASQDPIAFHTLYVWAKHYKFYINDTLIEEGGESEALNVTIPRDLIPDDRTVTFAFAIDPGDLSYQGVANRRDILIGAKSALKRTVFDAEELKTTFYLWFLLPKLTFCVVFAMVFVFVSRSRVLFMFVGYTFVSGLDTFLFSGYAARMLPSAENLEFYATMAQVGASCFFFGFLYEFYGAHGIRSGRALLGALGALFVGAGVTTWVFGPNVAFNLLNGVYAILQPAAFFYGGVRAWRTRAQWSSGASRFLCAFFLLSTIPALIQTWHTVSDLLGLNLHLGIDVNWIHGLVMFLVLTALAIIDVGRSLLAKYQVEQELKSVNERLELGRTVQNMLLPVDMAGGMGDASYKYFHESAEQMAGDWLTIWRAEGRRHLFLGDVVGKGPQAALAVAAISSMINDCRHQNASMEECVERINRQLIDLFRKHITSTLSAITFHDDGSVELYNAGAIGWFALTGNEIRYLSMRGMPLGVAPDLPVAKKRLTFPPGTVLFAFTDGCLEGSRALKNLFTRLRARTEPSIEFDELHRIILEVGKEHVLVDDQTVLIVKLPGEAQLAEKTA